MDAGGRFESALEGVIGLDLGVGSGDRAGSDDRGGFLSHHAEFGIRESVTFLRRE